MYDPVEGHVDPYGVTHAYAKAAQIEGATIERQTRVTDLQPRPDGTWDVITEKGNIHAEHVVNAGGLWAREVGRMVGLELPMLAMEHQYLITEDMPELVGQKEQLHCIDFEGEIYMRQERGGMLIGTYEQAGVPWSERATPWDFGQNLLPNDLDRIAPEPGGRLRAFPGPRHGRHQEGRQRALHLRARRQPAGRAGQGPARISGWPAACMAGFSQGGGVGLALSNWMVDGDPGFDIWGMDVSRYGDWATMAYTNAKVRENYSRRFRIRFPNEELPAGAAAAHDADLRPAGRRGNAVFGEYCGLEHPLWFAPPEQPLEDRHLPALRLARRTSAAECRAVRDGVGLLEISNYGKFEVTGPRREAFLSQVMANAVPAVGRMVLTPMLNERGKLIGDFTVGAAGRPTGSSSSAPTRPRATTCAGSSAYLPADRRARCGPAPWNMPGLSVAGPQVARAAAGAGVARTCRPRHSRS